MVTLDHPLQSVQYSDSIQAVMFSALDVPADTLTAAPSHSTDNGATFSAGLPGGLTLLPSGENWILAGVAATGPGDYLVRITVSDKDGGTAEADTRLTVEPEDARVEYTGPRSVTTMPGDPGVATLPLRTTIYDITALFPDLDPTVGNISSATVTFIHRETDTVIAADLPVSLPDPADPATGQASYDWTVDIGTLDSQEFTIGIVVGGYYTRDDTADDTVVTVSQPASDVRIEEIIINDGDDQRSNIETITVRFSQNVNLQELIDGGQITSAVLLHELAGAQFELEGARFDYDPATATLRIDLSTDGFGSHHGTMLTDGRYRLGFDTQFITAAGDATARLLDDDLVDEAIRTFDFHRFLADFDGDATIGLDDRARLFERFGSSEGDDLYDYAFDLNEDGLIESADYYRWKSRYLMELE